MVEEPINSLGHEAGGVEFLGPILLYKTPVQVLLKVTSRRQLGVPVKTLAGGPIHKCLVLELIWVERSSLECTRRKLGEQVSSCPVVVFVSHWRVWWILEGGNQ